MSRGRHGPPICQGLVSRPGRPRRLEWVGPVVGPRAAAAAGRPDPDRLVDALGRLGPFGVRRFRLARCPTIPGPVPADPRRAPHGPSRADRPALSDPPRRPPVFGFARVVLLQCARLLLPVPDGRSALRLRGQVGGQADRAPGIAPTSCRSRTAGGSATPEWDRYGKGHPLLDDYPYTPGRAINPFRQSVLKGDYPILGQHTFFEFTGSTLAFFEYREIPTQTTPFESTSRAGEFAFFGRPSQFFYTQFFNLSFDLFHGDAAFKPVDWRIKVTPIFNVNSLATNELAQVDPNVLDGTFRNRTFFALQEFFGELKLADTSPNYDFVSARVGSQLFVSDFRGFIFADVNRGARIFGTRNANRDQYNLVYFRQFEKDTNSGLNSFNDRGQNIFIANYYRQDFIFPGYTAQASIHYNNDQGSFKINKNQFLNRPDPDGIYQRHEVDAIYFGFTGDGHWNRFNVTNAFYWVVGRDSMNPLANRPPADQRPVRGDRAVLRPRLDAVPDVVLVRVGR